MPLLLYWANRRRLVALPLFLLFIFILSIFTLPPAQAESTLRIGYQKSSTLLTILKLQGALEKTLNEQGVKVTWHEFSSGLPLLEALNLGNVDISADVADTVPVFAQAAGAKLTYVALETPSPAAQAILVPDHSPLNSLAELKGKRIAVTKAAGSHFLLIAALAKANLSFKDITPAYLTPADGRAALENGNVDAWVTWEPFVSSAIVQQKARVLADGEGLASYQRYYLAATNYARQHPEILNIIFQQLEKTGQWVKANPDQAAALLGPQWGNLDSDTVKLANANRTYQVRPVTPQSLGEQQHIADAFFNEGLLPERINAQEVAIWHPTTGQSQ
ncbi:MULTISPECIES: aliphatic sulfonate ABC transporter substrate-binding protein [unclassified Brenneria]|uniref:aliphatic sulfonate ABC transporter substrate-binding protein n=1 Tax=unclassified Brenneria TaxID=2634434 RepID=UPI00155463C4|nr:MULTISPECIES: aliphatic sulfonate ABC transporter substrate-binding protein [unclassified Brenneria]MBJ7221516.1 aliphatic sulfonate ABC transporter substrate-binding protein [Brenneria sp. L3-3C-1]MEE3642758.1 aliphatic sulfonate ABC transporter substrate-binding protein [Brenneria sp. L3_3C_1]MEE3651060.1 aliphatic sulfonate ABC transporter substrate-binding protein [Brenneria sp. HEZEL_4_2_4]NPD01015.1 aliphatic sulfonate ABC transporter substrate-binding protein [Brenneria sp. hezel4-2-4